MNFFRYSLIKITVLIITIWVMPSTSFELETARTHCRKILMTFCGYNDNLSDYDVISWNKDRQANAPNFFAHALENFKKFINDEDDLYYVEDEDYVEDEADDLPIPDDEKLLRKHINDMAIVYKQNLNTHDDHLQKPLTDFCSTKITDEYSAKQFFKDIISGPPPNDLSGPIGPSAYP